MSFVKINRFSVLQLVLQIILTNLIYYTLRHIKEQNEYFDFDDEFEYSFFEDFLL